jgi:Pentapeptide repeats (8 copies)
VAQQGQVTDQYNAAITNLGSRSIEVRLGGIYALQRLMQDTPAEQPAVIAVLCAFVRNRTGSIRAQRNASTYQTQTDVRAALTVVASRDRANDGTTTVIDFSNVRLPNAQLDLLNLSQALFTGAYLDNAGFSGADLTGANFNFADLHDATLVTTTLTGAGEQPSCIVGEHGSGSCMPCVEFCAHAAPPPLTSTKPDFSMRRRRDCSRVATGSANDTVADSSSAPAT